MTFDEYEKTYAAIYAEFAATLRVILEKAVTATAGAPIPQSIQARAKDPVRLRARLEEKELVASTNIENERKDLAGVRLIFYTNSDVDRFLASRLIIDNFEVEHEATKIHHPSKETGGNRYQGIHYIVRLKEDRARLPEYAKFAGLRCEIQIQTILNHSWSETSHDIIYKDKLSDGFGKKELERITKRFNKIMDEYLLPAGYEFQRIQHDYDRLLQGKVLFDRDAIQSLLAAKDNNERHELLTTLRDFTLPNYDDHAAIYDDLRDTLIAVAKAARLSPTVPLDSTFGQLEGKSGNIVVATVVQIFNQLRYVNLLDTFDALCEILRGEQDAKVRKAILDAIKQLAEYNIDAFKQVGIGIQMALADRVEGFSEQDRLDLRPVIVTVWRELLQSDITGTKWTAEQVILSRGTVPVSEELKTLRSKAMEGLFVLFDTATSDGEKREILNTLDQATRTGMGGVTDELLALALTDGKRIVDFVKERVTDLSYELLSSLEHRFWLEYRIPKGILANKDGRFSCGVEAADLLLSIEQFRDLINQDVRFVRYKTLVGFESVFPQHWQDEDFDYAESEHYRTAEAESYIAGITPDNEDEWFDLIERCAATKSNDMATFPMFGKFLVNLAKNKPAIAERYAEKAGVDLQGFLTAFLDGLYSSAEPEIYQRVAEGLLNRNKHLWSLARHLRNSQPADLTFATEILTRSIANSENLAVIECLLFAMEAPQEKVPPKAGFFRIALEHLTRLKDSRWVRGAWYNQKIDPFYASASAEEIALMLENMLALPKIDSEAERILSKIAAHHLEAVWDYFGKRLKVDTTGDEFEERFEAVPYAFHGLQNQLSTDPKLAVRAGRAWYTDDDAGLFRFRGGRLLSAAFPNCTEEFANELSGLVDTGDDADADFVLAIMQNYRGEVSTHAVLKSVIARYPTDVSKIERVRISFDSTGVVSGDDGWANALREKKEQLTAWLGDERTAVRSFAERHIQELEQNIIYEQKRADQQREMRRREFDDDSNISDDDG